MLKLRRAIVVEAEPPKGGEQSLLVTLSAGSSVPGEGHDRTGERPATSEEARRRALADVGLVGPSELGDQVLVNTEALDLGLGSGGFDLVHANLTRGLQGEGSPGAHVMKLNYTSLQHVIEPVEEERLRLPLQRPVAVLALHGQLAPVAWSFAQAAPGRRLGYVQTAGGALPGGHSRVVRILREAGLLAGHVTAGAAFGGESEAITTAGALHYGQSGSRFDAIVCGPGPGIVGSNSPLGHGGMVALDSAHTALALGAETLLVARMSSGDPRERHRGISHHTLRVLDLLLAPVTVALPAGMRSPVGADLRAGLGAVFGAPVPSRPQLELEVDRPARITRHDWRRAPVDLPGFATSGLPADTMGRGPLEDPLFFGAALAGGAVLADMALHAEQASGIVAGSEATS